MGCWISEARIMWRAIAPAQTLMLVIKYHRLLVFLADRVNVCDVKWIYEGTNLISSKKIDTERLKISYISLKTY